MSKNNQSRDSSLYWENSARDHYLKRDYNEASASIDSALTIDPENYHALILGAAILSELGRSEAEIVPLYDRAIRKRPDDAEAYSAKALALADNGHHREAVEIAREALVLLREEENNLRDKAYSVYDTLADVLFRFGDIEEARHVAKEAESRYCFDLWAQDN